MARRFGKYAHLATASSGGWHALALLLLAITSNSSWAQLPATQLHALSPTGGRAGTVVDVQIAGGADLDAVDQLTFSHEGISAVQKTTDPAPFHSRPQPVAGQFLVTIAANVPPGLYEARASGRFGISNPRAFVVGDLPEIREVEDNNSPEKANAAPLNSVVNAAADATAVDYYKIALKKGQKVVLDCWAERIDSRMDATLVVLDAAGRELARDRDSNRDDPLIVFAAPADGDYLVKVYDFLYRGGAEYFYRLAVSTGPHVDFVFPPAGLPGSKGRYTIYGGNLPGGTPAKGMTVAGRELEQLAVEIEFPAGDAEQQMSMSSIVKSDESPLDGFEYRLRTPQGSSNPYFLGFAAAPVVVEAEPNDDATKPQVVSVPCEFSGRFDRRGDDDWIAFDAKKGDDFWVEVISQRLGLATDPYVLLQRVTKNEKGEIQVSDIQELDDTPKNIGGFSFKTATDDPSFRFQVPGDGSYRILVRNLDPGARDDPRKLYRLSIRRPRPDFRLVAVPVFHSNNKATSAPSSPLVRRGGTETIDVLAMRQDGFDGAIDVSVMGLPPGVTAARATIGRGQDSTTLVLTAADDAAASAGTIQIVGIARLGEQTLLRPARAGTVLWSAAENQIAPARLSRDLALAVSGEDVLPFRVEVGDRKTWTTSLAGTLEVPVKVIRQKDFKQPITLAPQGLPPNVKAKPITIAADASEGKLAIEVARNAAEGQFNFQLQAQTTLSYRRDPQSADEATTVKQEIEKIATALMTASTAAEQVKQAAIKAATDVAAAVKQAADAQVAAVQAAKTAADQAKAAAEKVTQATALAEKDPQNQTAQAARQAAEQASRDMQTVAETAAKAQVEADKLATDMAAKSKAAELDKSAKEKAAADAAAQAKAAADAKAAAEKRAAELAAAAQPKNVNVFESSMPVSLDIAAAPLDVAILSPATPLKAGTQVEVPLSLARKYGFADKVEIELLPPAGAKGVAAAKLELPANQARGKLVIVAAADAAVGLHALVVRAKLKFNGQDLQVEQIIPLVVEPPAPPPAPPAAK